VFQKDFSHPAVAALREIQSIILLRMLVFLTFCSRSIHKTRAHNNASDLLLGVRLYDNFRRFSFVNVLINVFTRCCFRSYAATICSVFDITCKSFVIVKLGSHLS
jgi:hypothetical protein